VEVSRSSCSLRSARLRLGALVWTATEEDIVLLLPSAAVSAAWAALSRSDHPRYAGVVETITLEELP